MHTLFDDLPRQRFRRYFQPSRIVLGLLHSRNISGVNIITLCFDMYCSYKPPMMAIAVQKVNASYELILDAREWVLSVPGVDLVDETLYCGTKSGRNVDKVRELGIELHPSTHVGVPGIRNAIANIELVRHALVESGDHVTAFGRVVKFGVRHECKQLPLLSIGPDTRGYKVLARRGIHRIGVVDADEPGLGDVGKAP